jgi:hypothetical protein
MSKGHSAFELLAAVGWPPVRLADALDESIATVCNWRARGIPAHQVKAVEALTGVSVVHLRPHDWRAYWPDAEVAA